MKVLITGGTGFIGLHLARYLAEKGCAITLADNFFRGKNDEDVRETLALPNVKLIVADLTKADEMEKIGSGYDHVYHLAAVNGTKYFYEIPAEVLRINIAATLNIIEWMRSKNAGGKILFTSSNEAYAGLEALGKLPIPTPEDVPLIVFDIWNPRWSYAATKLIGESLFINYQRQYGIPFVIVRPHNFYGPRAGGEHVIPQFLNRIHAKQDPFTISGGAETRSFCFIKDAVEAMATLMENANCANQTFHIGTTEEVRIKDLAEMMFDLFDFHPRVIMENAPQGSVKRRLPDISKIEAAIGWRPKTALREGLKLTSDWYFNNFRTAQKP